MGCAKSALTAVSATRSSDLELFYEAAATVCR